jgi:hypothetical protein
MKDTNKRSWTEDEGHSMFESEFWDKSSTTEVSECEHLRTETIHAPHGDTVWCADCTKLFEPWHSSNTKITLSEIEEIDMSEVTACESICYLEEKLNELIKRINEIERRDKDGRDLA